MQIMTYMKYIESFSRQVKFEMMCVIRKKSAVNFVALLTPECCQELDFYFL